MTATDDADRDAVERARGRTSADRANDPSADGRPGTFRTRSAVDVDERADLPAHRCARCGRPFADESLLALHRGFAHAGALDDEEVSSFRAAHAAEEDAIRRYRLLAVVGLLVCYFGLLMLYAVV